MQEETWQEPSEAELMLPERNRGSQRARRVLIYRHVVCSLSLSVSFLLIEWCLEAKNLRYLVFLKAVSLAYRVLY